VVRRHPRFDVDVGKQTARLLIRAAHLTPDSASRQNRIMRYSVCPGFFSNLLDPNRGSLEVAHWIVANTPFD
jgi:hypothetical protein